METNSYDRISFRLTFVVPFFQFLSLTGGLLMPEIIHSQQIEKSPKRWTVEDGLPSNSISDIFMDHQHYLWVGTLNGLCRFNGKEFEHFADNPNIDHGLKGDYVRSIGEDEQRRIYVLIQGGGLCRYDPKRPEHGFEEILSTDHFPRLKGHGVLSYILKVDSAAVYVFYADTIRRYLFSDQTFEVYDPFAGAPAYKGFKIHSTQPIKNRTNLTSSWHPDHGLIVYDVATAKIHYQTPFEILQKIKLLNSNKASVRFNIHDPYVLILLESGHFWLLDRMSQTLVVEGQVPVPEGKKLIKGFPFSDGSFSVSFDDEIIYEYDPVRRHMKELKFLRMVDDSISMTYRGFIVTPDKNQWIATNHGLLLWNKSEQGFANYEVRIQGYPYQSTNAIYNLFSTSAYPLLVATQAGLHVFDSVTKTFSNPDFYNGKERYIPKGYSWAAGKRVFIGSGHVHELDIERGTATRVSYIANPDDVTRFEKSTKAIALQDTLSSGLNWWIGVNRGGVYHWKVDSHILHRVPLIRFPDQEYIIRLLNYDVFGRLVVFCGLTGMYFINPKTYAIETYIPIDSMPSYGLQKELLIASTRSPDGNIWMSQQSVGLVRLTFDANRRPVFTVYGKEKGLSNGFLYVVQSDDEGNIWMSTHSGIEKWDVHYQRFFHFGAEHGIIENQLRWPVWKDEQGHIYFAGSHKFVVFHPDSLSLQTAPPAVFIKRIQVNAIARSDLIDQSDIRLKPGERNIFLEFDAIEYRNPQKLLFRYRITKKGEVESTWTTSDNFEISMASLSPGEYTIQFNAANEHRFWNDTDSEIRLFLPNPWYATIWFISGCILLVAGFFYSLYRYQIRHLKKILAIRNRISRDLHDDIGSTLGSISIYSEVAKTTSSENRTDVLDKIGDGSREMLEKLNDIVWSINPENDTLEKMEKRMRSYAAMILNPIGIGFNLHLKSNDQTTRLDMEHRRHLFLIYKEALHNAAKYAQCKHIEIKLEENGGKLSMDIRDDGIGFDPLHQSGYNGNGLNSMKERAKAIGASLLINSSPGHGTTIHLEQ